MALSEYLTILCFVFGVIVIPYLVWSHRRVDRLEKEGSLNTMDVSALKSDFDRMQSLHQKTPERLAIVETELRNIGKTVSTTTKELKISMNRMEAHILRAFGHPKLAQRLITQQDDDDESDS